MKEHRKWKYREQDNNTAALLGTVRSGVEASTLEDGRMVWKFTLEVARSSRVPDILPVWTFFPVEVEDGDRVLVTGKICGRNMYMGDKKMLSVYVYADSIMPDHGGDWEDDVNSIILTGTICKIGEVRTTPRGRVVCDMIVASNYGRYGTNYVPCIAWYDTADKAKRLGIGRRVSVKGRFQSREYVKHYEDHEEIKTAYELSIRELDKNNKML